jgi:hypothetical protein
VADAIEKEVGVKPEMVYGNRGEFSIVVNGETVARKGLILFPTIKKVVEAVKGKLSAASTV